MQLIYQSKRKQKYVFKYNGNCDFRFKYLKTDLMKSNGMSIKTKQMNIKQKCQIPFWMKYEFPQNSACESIWKKKRLF